MALSTKYGKVTFERGDFEDDEPVFVIRGKDKLAPEGIMAYEQEADGGGASEEFLAAVREEAVRAEVWQADHPDKVKMPD